MSQANITQRSVEIIHKTIEGVCPVTSPRPVRGQIHTAGAAGGPSDPGRRSNTSYLSTTHLRVYYSLTYGPGSDGSNKQA